MCPNKPFYPMQCIDNEPDLWRVGEIEEGYECSVFLIPQFDVYFTAYSMWDKGMLPFSNLGWAEHPYRVIQAIEIIGSQIARVQREAIKPNKNNDSE